MSDINLAEEDYRLFLEKKEKVYRDILRINAYVCIFTEKTLKEGGLGKLQYTT
jgi:hypothetical protein